MSHARSTSYITHLNLDLLWGFDVLRGENFGEDQNECCLEVKKREPRGKMGQN
jgi:hypothetical protein